MACEGSSRGVRRSRKGTKGSAASHPRGRTSDSLEEGPNGARLERWLSAAAIVIALVGFGALLVALPPFFQSFDEAKYVGIGRNVLAGRGIVTIDGTPILEHSPLWSVAIVAPALVLGGSPLDWGRVLDAAAGLGLVALVAAFGWRVRPAVGGLAAAVFVGFVYVHDLARTARLDVPAAALTLAALGGGLRAFERRSSTWAAGAGLLFGLAGLVKEIVLPFAPVPLLVAILRGVPIRTVVRLSGWMGLAALATTAWWFVVAESTGRIYRLGLPAASLGPLLAGGVVASVAAIGVDRLAAVGIVRRLRLPLWLRGGAGPAAVAEPEGRRLGRTLLVVGAALGWFALQLLFYAQSRDARLPNLLNVGQLRTYAATWAPALGLVGGFVAGGAAILVGRVLLRRSRGSPRPADRIGPAVSPAADESLAMAELAIALVCGMPLVLLVATLGEPPRNYLAQIGLAVALAAGGWIWLAEAVAGRGRASWLAAGAATGLAAGAATGLAAGLALVAIRLEPALALVGGLGVGSSPVASVGSSSSGLGRSGGPGRR